MVLVFVNSHLAFAPTIWPIKSNITFIGKRIDEKSVFMHSVAYFIWLSFKGGLLISFIFYHLISNTRFHGLTKTDHYFFIFFLFNLSIDIGHKLARLSSTCPHQTCIGIVQDELLNSVVPIDHFYCASLILFFANSEVIKRFSLAIKSA